MSIAHLDGTGLDETGPPPLDFFYSGGWTVGVLTDQTQVPNWGRLSNKLYCQAANPGTFPVLYTDAHEEDVQVTTVMAVETAQSGIMFRFDDPLDNGWIVTDTYLIEYHNGVNTVRDSWTTLGAGATLSVVADGTSITVYNGASVIGGYISDVCLHETRHGLVVAQSDLSARWNYIDIDNAPISDNLLGSAPGTATQARGALFGRQRPAAPSQSMHPQQGLQIVRDSYAVVDGIAQDPPLFGSMSRSVAYARSFSPTANLGDALSLGANDASSRWLADVADVVPRLDLGADVTEWQPHFGSDPGFKFYAVSAPFVEPGYVYWASGKRKKTTQAMVFDGNHWGQSLLGSSVSVFAWIIVAVLHHPSARAWQDILASPSSAADPVQATDAVLRYHQGRIQSLVAGKMSEADLHPPIYRARLRPTILVWSEDPNGGTLGVIDAHGRHFHDYHHSTHIGFDLRMYLGVNGATVSADYATEMDVLDIGYYTTRLTAKTARPMVNRLDHVYGVTGR